MGSLRHDVIMAAAAEKSQHEAVSLDDVERRASIAQTEKGRWERLWPVVACGAGLFSDGYLNNVRLHTKRLPPNATPNSDSMMHIDMSNH